MHVLIFYPSQRSEFISYVAYVLEFISNHTLFPIHYIFLPMWFDAWNSPNYFSSNSRHLTSSTIIVSVDSNFLHVIKTICITDFFSYNTAIDSIVFLPLDGALPVLPDALVFTNELPSSNTPRK